MSFGIVSTLSHLDFKDDTIFFHLGAGEKLNNLLSMMSLFCIVSGLKLIRAKCSLAGIIWEKGEWRF